MHTSNWGHHLCLVIIPVIIVWWVDIRSSDKGGYDARTVRPDRSALGRSKVAKHRDRQGRAWIALDGSVTCLLQRSSKQVIVCIPSSGTASWHRHDGTTTATTCHPVSASPCPPHSLHRPTNQTNSADLNQQNCCTATLIRYRSTQVAILLVQTVSPARHTGPTSIRRSEIMTTENNLDPSSPSILRKIWRLTSPLRTDCIQLVWERLHLIRGTRVKLGLAVVRVSAGRHHLRDRVLHLGRYLDPWKSYQGPQANPSRCTTLNRGVPERKVHQTRTS
jgi:hypothetical protein